MSCPGFLLEYLIYSLSVKICPALNWLSPKSAGAPVGADESRACGARITAPFPGSQGEGNVQLAEPTLVFLFPPVGCYVRACV